MKQKLGRDGKKKKFFLWIIIKSGGKRKIFIFTSLLILRELAMRVVILASPREKYIIIVKLLTFHIR